MEFFHLRFQWKYFHQKTAAQKILFSPERSSLVEKNELHCDERQTVGKCKRNYKPRAYSMRLERDVRSPALLCNGTWVEIPLPDWSRY